jgi:KaiC/GvpD/RAD55 family RecA-like ATPase
VNGFLSSADRIDEQESIQRELYRHPCKFGIPFLDDALTGLYADDLVILTARTGAGKTELSSQIACENAMAGKRVHLFALEAYPGEIENRMKFRMLSQAFFTQMNWREYGETPSYQDWIYGRQDHLLSKFDREIVSQLKSSLKNLHVFYRDESFNIDDFEGKMAMVGSESDLIIVDHLHHFDLNSDNEVSELKRTVKKMRDTTLFYRKPTLVVVHIRKQDRRFETLLPELDDIYGSSEISKICTKAIAVAPALDQEQDPGKKHLFPTYMRILKNRLDGSRTRFVSLSGFNIQKNSYEDVYVLGKEKYGKNEFEPITEKPQWAKNTAKHNPGILPRMGGRQAQAGYNPSDG